MKFLLCVLAIVLPGLAMGDIASVTYTDRKVESAHGVVPVIEEGAVVGTAQIWVE